MPGYHARIAAAAVLGPALASAQAAEFRVVIQGLEPHKGGLLVALYDSERTFNPRGDAVERIRKPVQRDAVEVTFTGLPATLTDFVFTALGVLLLGGTGYAMVFGGPWSFDTRWLDWGQSLFLATGIVWVGVLIPIQFVQARMARAFAAGGEIPVRYRQLAALRPGFTC